VDPQLAHLRDLVRGEHHLCLRPGLRNLLEQRRLARVVVADPVVLGHREHEVRDVVAETRAKLGGLGRGLLERVVQDAGRDDVVRRAALVQQRCDFQRVLDEVGAVGVPRLAGVQALGVIERGSRDRETLDEGGHTTSIVHAGSVKPLLSAGRARRDSSAGPRSPARRRRRPARS
jgi:hypothetical protein